jgi:hypothetical protein
MDWISQANVIIGRKDSLEDSGKVLREEGESPANWPSGGLCTVLTPSKHKVSKGRPHVYGPGEGNCGSQRGEAGAGSRRPD